jgi:hypothetical protein
LTQDGIGQVVAVQITKGKAIRKFVEVRVVTEWIRIKISIKLKDCVCSSTNIFEKQHLISILHENILQTHENILQTVAIHVSYGWVQHRIYRVQAREGG